VYTFVDRQEIIERVAHIRRLHREVVPATEQGKLIHARREQKTKDLLSNLRRTGEHPMLSTLLEFGDMHSLTVDGAHRLFGYELDRIRQYDLQLNGGRTHIAESYAFERDLLVELPRVLTPSVSFQKNGPLSTFVQQWQENIPIRALRRPGWQRAGTFYVHVGTEDSLGSSVPPGATAIVEPIRDEEAKRPDPRSTYLLQFPNGYRCSRCVVTPGKLQLLTSDRSYRGVESFSFPGSVRVAGRVRGFAVSLPLEPHLPQMLSHYDGQASLVLPFEQPTRESLFATKHRRFVRPKEETRRLDDFLQSALHFTLSERTKRRYRAETSSAPHVAALIHMTIEHFARYSDALRAGGYSLRDTGRYSLETMLRADHYVDLLAPRSEAALPTPLGVWEASRNEFLEWSPLLSLKFPQLSQWSDRMVRIAEEATFSDIEPRIRPGTWMLLEDLCSVPDTRTESTQRGWSRPLYVFREGLEMIFGHLASEGSAFALVGSNTASHPKRVLHRRELSQLRRVCGALVPV